MPPPQIHFNVKDFQTALLGWYSRHARPLPWRSLPETLPAGQKPYLIWVAEVMLQQTTVAAVIPYYQRFLAAFPTVQALAAATPAQVFAQWQGLGYYRRALYLHQAAQHIVTYHHGLLPSTEAELSHIKGFGPYTAAAVAAQAFGATASAVDGNVARVFARLLMLETPLPRLLAEVRHLSLPLVPPAAAARWANALMELGATVCTPRRPRCLICPLLSHCAGGQRGTPTAWPVRPAKKTLPEKHGTVFVITDPAGHVWLRHRTDKTLLGGLWEFPHTGWEEPFTTPLPILAEAASGTVVHTFTHFRLHLAVIRQHVATIPPAHRHSSTALPPLPTLMRKVFTLALSPLPAQTSPSSPAPSPPN